MGMHVINVFGILLLGLGVILSEDESTCPAESCIAIDDPVCGTDGTTYGSECLLNSAACKSDHYIDLAYKGRCDPCRNFTCQSPPYSECVSSGTEPKCMCSLSACPRVARPMCGSNGRTYRNDCKLRRHACRSRTAITVASIGSCPENKERSMPNSCDTAKCAFPAVCRMASGHGPVCTAFCPRVCPLPLDPVCGSDGRAYGNQCELWRERCRNTTSNRQLYVIRRGPCPVPDCPFLCSHGSVCQVKQGVARCVPVCHKACPEDLYKPVCGSDGITYSNECELEREACTRNKPIVLVHVGSCQDPCVNHTCAFPPYSICEVKAGRPTCGCGMNCPDSQHFVCGSDRVTYDNLCLMEQAACRMKKKITVTSKTLCSDPCLSVRPCKDSRPNAKCRTVDGVAKCVCTGLCSDRAREPVCGTDGLTYNNECELKTAACRQNKSIHVFNTGPCIDPCQFTLCKHYARCVSSGNSAKCVCPQLCPAVVKPVCGSDGATYKNECRLRTTSCREKTPITVTTTGPCVES